MDIIKFIQKIYGTTEFIPLHEPRFIGNEKQYLNECIDSTFVSSIGKYVDRFEEMVADYTGVKKTIVTVNGTNALHLSLRETEVISGDEVITQPLTFIATINAIYYLGASPVFIDVDKETMGLSPVKLQEWLAENTIIEGEKVLNKHTKRQIKAIVPVHTFGHPCKIDEIIRIANQYHIPVVEDAAESMGSFYKGKHTGTFGKFGILSFNGNKIITTGGGGMILTDNKESGDKIKHLSTQAKVPHKWEYVHDFVGYNYRMPNINASIGVAQMEQLDFFIERKRALAEQYKNFFQMKGINFFTEPPNAYSNYWLNAIILENKKERDLFLKETNDNKIMTRPIWELMNRLPMFKKFETGDLSNAEWLVDRVVNIPSSVILKK
ncbi:MAG TPA: LegC family aminotransferase [Bacteroidales bacterium]|nr:LegC family aminotransferase [Bacteroidales bacterium]